MARANSRCKDCPLANSPSFLEAEISLPTVHRLTDDDVVKHLDLKNPGSFAESTREAEISFARAWVSGYAACGIMQSIFGPASRRVRLWQHIEGDRRDGGLKMGWTKPVPSAWPYGY